MIKHLIWFGNEFFKLDWSSSMVLGSVESFQSCLCLLLHLNFLFQRACTYLTQQNTENCSSLFMIGCVRPSPATSPPPTLFLRVVEDGAHRCAATISSSGTHPGSDGASRLWSVVCGPRAADTRRVSVGECEMRGASSARRNGRWREGARRMGARCGSCWRRLQLTRARRLGSRSRLRVAAGVGLTSASCVACPLGALF
jgi:hypothetical protein